MGGKFGNMSAVYDYYGTMAGVVSIGLTADVIAIILNGQESWPRGTPWVLGANITAGTLYVYDAQTWTCTSNHVASAANAPGSGLEGWTEYTFARVAEDHDDFTLVSNDGTVQGLSTFYWGTTTQTVDPYLESTGNDGGENGNYGTGDQHPNYADLVYIVIKDFLLGEEVQSGPNIELVTRRVPNQAVVGGAAAGITDGQANLAAVAVELLTNENCLGLSTAIIDDVSFQATANYLQTNQALYGASVLIDSSESIPSLFDKITQMIDGFIRFNPSTQLIEMGVYQHGVIPVGYVTLTADSLTKYPKFNAKSWQETISRATVRYNDRQLNYQQTSVQVDDPRAFFVLGTVREQSIDRPWIVRQAQAKLHGQEFLRVVGHAQMTGELEVRREIGRTIRAGDYVLVDVDLEPNTNSLYQFFRVTKRKIPPTGPITLEVFADNTLAPVPWTNGQTPVTITAPVVPTITSFRFLEVPTILSGERGEIICLAQRPNNLLVGATIFFDTDPAGTFSTNLGIFTTFAAKATLHANVAATDGTIQLTVDTTQVDADYFTQQYSTLEQADDTMLAFIVSVVAGGGDAGEVAESGGFQIMEIVSVGTQTLISAGQYNISALRGRKNTTPSAFTIANTEVWLIPASLLAFFNNSTFDVIRANRLAGLTPAYAQFRICPYTFVNSLALSAATSEQFRFPLKSITAPTLTLTAPNTFDIVQAVTQYPYLVQVTGTWNDPDGRMVEVKILLRNSTETTDRVVFDTTFAPCSQYTFNNFVAIDAAGTYTIKLIARDALNLVTERDITVTVTGSGAQCAMPSVYDSAGAPVINTDGTPPTLLNDPISHLGINIKWGILPKRFIPYGVLSLLCSTPGATIYFTTTALIQSGNVVDTLGDLQMDFETYLAGQTMPFHGLSDTTNQSTGDTSIIEYYILNVWATAPGYAQSDGLKIIMPLVLPLPHGVQL